MNAAKRPRVVFVVPRYGSEICGGAETHARMVAERMAQHWDVRVFTTCARDYVSWADVYAPGESIQGGVGVHRFPVAAPRDIADFNRISEMVLQGGASLEQEEEWMRKQGPECPLLLEALAEAYPNTDLFIFAGYLYALTYFGLPLVADKAALIPMAHDEPTLKLGLFANVFQKVRYLMYNTLEERRLLEQRFDLPSNRGEVVGAGIERAADQEPPRERPRSRPYLLYIGRIDFSKGVGELFDYYTRESLQVFLDLVLIGEAKIEIPSHPGIIHLGFVTSDTRSYLLKNAVALVQPSLYESLSLTVLEAWDEGTPVLVNGNCEVLVGQCRRSGGGLEFRNSQELAEHALDLMRRPVRRLLMGMRGRRYVEEHYRWERIIPKYQALLSRIKDSSGTGDQ